MRHHRTAGVVRSHIGRSLTVVLTASPLLIAALASFLLTAGVAAADTVYWGRHPDKDRLVVHFDETAPDYQLTRTGELEMTLVLPEGYWREQDRKPEALLTPTAQRLDAVTPGRDGFTVRLKNPEFGFVHFVLDEENKLVIDIFPDAMGARWSPGEDGAKAVNATTSPEPAQAPPPPAPSEPTPEPAQAQPAQDEPAPARQDEAPVQEAIEQAEEDAALQASEAVMEATPPTPPISTEAANATPPSTPQAQPAEAAPLQAPEAAPPQPRRTVRMPMPPRDGGVAGGVRDNALPDAEQPEPVAPANPSAEPSAFPQPVTPPETPPPPQGDAVQPPPASLDSPGRPDVQTPPAAASSSALDAPAAPTAVRRPVTASPPSPSRSIRMAMPRRDGAPASATPAASPASEMAAAPDAEATAPSIPQPVGEPVAAAQDAGEEAREQTAQTTQPAPAVRPFDQQSERPAAGEADAPAGADTDAEPAGDLAEGAARVAAARPKDVPEGIIGAEAALEQLTFSQNASAQVAEDGEAAAPVQPQFESILQRAKMSFLNKEHDIARQLLRGLIEHPGMPEALREEALYYYADTLYATHKDDLREHYDDVVSAYKAAMNFDPDSANMPGALLKMGVINLAVGNPREADAYFNLLEQNYPGDENIPLVHYYKGDYYFKKGLYKEAADRFQFIIQNYPDSQFTRESGVGLARSLQRLGFDEQAADIVDFLEKRYPRFYVEYPPFLRLVGDVSYKAGEYEKAKRNLWTFYNLDPEGEEADLALARLGDIYVQEDKLDAAREVYQQTADTFPDREGGLIAKMRLAEEGIYDEPSLEDMFSVFERPYTSRPEAIYKEIVTHHPDSGLAPLAQLKLAMLRLYNNQVADALVEVREFLDNYPQSPLMDQAKGVAADAFGQLVERMVEEENFAGVARLWDSHPAIRAMSEDLRPETRLAVGLGLWKAERPEDGWRLVQPFLVTQGMPQYSEMALNLALSIALENKFWDRIVDMRPVVDGWELSAGARDDYNYALALAFENLGQDAQGGELWRELADEGQLDPTRFAYAQYFMAQNARREGDLKTAYEKAQSSLSHFLESGQDEEKVEDLLTMLIDIAENGGRVREALAWAMDLNERLPEGDAEKPALRYRMAQLYRKAQDMERWRAILTDLSQQTPESLYGRMAAMDLRTQGIEQSLQSIAPNI